MREKVWVNPNKMLVQSGNKTFDRQCDIVAHGNVTARCQMSSHIRPTRCAFPSGEPAKDGQMRDFDLKHFKNLPHGVQYLVRLHAGNGTETILYEFRHWRGEHKVVHGYVLTEAATNVVLATMPSRFSKSYAVLQHVIPYISNEEAR
jgi:hypothetical protein